MQAGRLRWRTYADFMTHPIISSFADLAAFLWSIVFCIAGAVVLLLIVGFGIAFVIGAAKTAFRKKESDPKP